MTREVEFEQTLSSKTIERIVSKDLETATRTEMLRFIREHLSLPIVNYQNARMRPYRNRQIYEHWAFGKLAEELTFDLPFYISALDRIKNLEKEWRNLSHVENKNAFVFRIAEECADAVYRYGSLVDTYWREEKGE